jgi:hypothetical protein
MKVSILRNTFVDLIGGSPIPSTGYFWRLAGIAISPLSHGPLDFSHLLSQSLMNDYQEA